MLKVLHLPELAEGVTSAVVVAMRVKPGDTVVADQIVAELENEKATAELPIPFSGTVQEIFKKPGDNINVGDPLLSVEVAGESEARSNEAENAPKEKIETQKKKTEQSSETVPAEWLLPAGPESRRLARELGVDLKLVTGTGPEGRITPEDVKYQSLPIHQGEQDLDRKKTSSLSKEMSPAPAISPELPDFSKWGDIEEQPMSGVRRKTASVVALSWREIPHVTQHDQADITDLDVIRNEWQSKAQEAGVKLTVTAILLKVTAAALKKYPRFNCSVDMENHKLIYKKYIHLSVAVDAGHGLLTPVIRNADEKSIFAIATELASLSAKARDKRLLVEEMAGGTFSVSNLGGQGTLAFNPIVTWPQVAVLGVGSADMKPVWRDDQFVPRKILPLFLSYDHRANDGADAARFLRFIAEAAERPLKLIMEVG
jgi:pyruvate dehydrogenase E2 component (dihydrolipoamide acetyltransferase)